MKDYAQKTWKTNHQRDAFDATLGFFAVVAIGATLVVLATIL